MPANIETTSYTLAVYSTKEDLAKLDDPAPLDGSKELAVELAKAGLIMTGKTEASGMGLFVDAKDESGNIVRVKVTPK